MSCYSSRSLRGLALACISGLLLGGAPCAQKLINKDLPRNHPQNDPYTLGQKELLEAAGILSLGGFEFGKSDTATVDRDLAVADIRWIETEHFELGFALGTYKVRAKEKKTIQIELTELSQKLPEVSLKTKQLDSWLRAHLYAHRLEKMYVEFLDLVQLTESDFPDGSAPWDMTGTYRGEGPHLGQKGKYEVLILPSEGLSVAFLDKHFGLQVRRTQRYNVPDRDTLTLTIHTQQGTLKSDEALHGHLAFNLIQNLLNGFEHYSYDIPVWLLEGMAHWAERRVTENFNTFDGAEGSLPETSRKSDWAAATKKVVTTGKAPRMATLVRKQGYGQLSLPDHYAVWSMIDFIHQTRPDGLARFIQALKGRTDENGFSDNSDLLGHHRKIFREYLGMSYSEFDTAWAEWVLSSY